MHIIIINVKVINGFVVSVREEIKSERRVRKMHTKLSKFHINCQTISF